MNVCFITTHRNQDEGIVAGETALETYAILDHKPTKVEVLYKVNYGWARCGKVANVWSVDYIRIEELNGKYKASCRPKTSRVEGPVLPPGYLKSGETASCKFRF